MYENKKTSTNVEAFYNYFEFCSSLSLLLYPDVFPNQNPIRKTTKGITNKNNITCTGPIASVYIII